MKNATANKQASRGEWMAQMQGLWPAIKGSLAQVRKPCIRKNCAACASGQKHPAWILSVVAAGRRSTLYVAEARAGEIQQAIKNGREIEVLLQKAAIQMVKYFRTTANKRNKTAPKS
jgi:hypothetical protein